MEVAAAAGEALLGPEGAPPWALLALGGGATALLLAFVSFVAWRRRRAAPVLYRAERAAHAGKTAAAAAPGQEQPPGCEADVEQGAHPWDLHRHGKIEAEGSARFGLPLLPASPPQLQQLLGQPSAEVLQGAASSAASPLEAGLQEAGAPAVCLEPR